MRSVPQRSTANSAVRTPTVSGTTTGASPGSTTFRPSLADRTDSAGVMALSP